MKQLRAFIFCLLPLTLASLLGACGGSGSTTATAPQEVRVAMGEMYVKPAITTFKVGQPYKLVLISEQGLRKILKNLTESHSILEFHAGSRNASTDEPAATQPLSRLDAHYERR